MVKFWFVTNKEMEKINEFALEHLHPQPLEDIGTVGVCPFHLEIKPNSVSYSVIIVCDICAKKRFKKLRRIKWIKDVTDYDNW